MDYRLEVSTKNISKKEYIVYRLSGDDTFPASYRSASPYSNCQKENIDLTQKDPLQPDLQSFLQNLVEKCFSPTLCKKLIQIIKADSPLEIVCDTPILAELPWEPMVESLCNGGLNYSTRLYHRNCKRQCIPITNNDLPLRIAWIAINYNKPAFIEGTARLEQIQSRLVDKFSALEYKHLVNLSTGFDRFSSATPEDVKKALTGSDIFIFLGNQTLNLGNLVYGFETSDDEFILSTLFNTRQNNGKPISLPKIVFCLGSPGIAGLGAQFSQLGVPYVYCSCWNECASTLVFNFVEFFLDELFSRLSKDVTLHEIMGVVGNKLEEQSDENPWPHISKFGVFNHLLVIRDQKIVNYIKRATDQRDPAALLSLLRVFPPNPQLSCLAINYLLDPQIEPLVKAEILLLLQEHQFPASELSPGEISTIQQSGGQNAPGMQILKETLDNFLSQSTKVWDDNQSISIEFLSLLDALDRSHRDAVGLSQVLDRFLEHRLDLYQVMESAARSGLLLDGAKEYVNSRLSSKKSEVFHLTK